jgi:3-oxoacyl-[acyl-carrier-protein] synthase II
MKPPPGNTRAPHPPPHIVISGWGLITPLGLSAWSTFSSLLQGKTIADRCANLPPNLDPVALVRAVGCVACAQHTSSDPALELAERAAREALAMAHAESAQIPAVIGASKGAMHTLAMAVNGYLHKDSSGCHRKAGTLKTARFDTAECVALGPHGYLSSRLQQRLPLGWTTNIVAACASGLTALHAARLILTRSAPPPQPPRVLVLSYESSLIPYLIYSYDRLGVLAPLDPLRYRALPLDRRRSGFMLSEMGVAVVLEVVDQPRPGQVVLLDTAVSTEGYDLIRPAPGMPALRRVAHQLFASRRIDVIHPHATGTPDHDPAELQAYAATLQQPDPPDLYACKGAIGHGLGASGLASLVIACMSAKTGTRPPMPWLQDPIPSPIPIRSAPPVTPSKHASPDRASSHAVFACGFAGHVAGAVIQNLGEDTKLPRMA